MTVNRAFTVTTATDCATEISSISEGYTTRAVNPDVRLTEDQKLQLLEKTYLSEQWIPSDDHEIDKVRKVIRKHIFKQLKFVKGEGTATDTKKTDKGKNKNKRQRTPVYAIGKCHERPDLRKKTGYEVKILSEVGKDERTSTIVSRALWWKTYQSHVYNEIRQLRGRVNNNVKQCLITGKP